MKPAVDPAPKPDAASRSGAPRRGLPLSLRILLWCGLNLLLLVAVLLWVLFRGQLGLGLDSLLTGRAGERLQSMADVLSGELSGLPEARWDAVISRTSTAYGVRLVLVRLDGRWWAGEKMELPPEVRKRVMEPPPPGAGRFSGGGMEADFPGRDGPRPHLGRGPEDRGFRGGQPEGRPLPDGLRGDGPPPGRDGRPRGLGRPPAPRARFLVKDGNPPLYWAGIPMMALKTETGRPGPAMLLAVADSLTEGGWVIDPVPWLAAGFGGLGLSVLLWFPLVRGITRSIRVMTAATERIAEGKFDTVAGVGRSDELGRLAHAINHLAGRLEHFVNGQRRFLGDIAHELCSPLARMQLGISLLERTVGADSQERVADVREEVEVMTQLVNELLSFSKSGLRARDLPLEAVPLADMAGNVISREASSGDVILTEIPETLTAMADAELLSRAVANLVRNALRYAGHAGPVRIGARAEEGQVTLTVSDSGPGVPEADLERIFEPFHRPDTARTREAGGSGLGLAIVRSCVEACQGSVSAANKPPSGLAVTIRLNPGPEIPVPEHPESKNECR
ncbi:MAG: molecular chaperone Hsp90 [Verrucomicrobiales bacterium]|nr:molecular chaperone Hsp90 [Verrucomicrobiales bacterium]